MKSEHRITIKEADWKDSKYRTRQWEETVEIVNWVHDYENKEYTIDYNSKKS